MDIKSRKQYTEQTMLNRTEIKDSFEILVDYQNELYGADYEIILDEKDCPLCDKAHKERR